METWSIRQLAKARAWRRTVIARTAPFPPLPPGETKKSQIGPKLRMKK